MGESYVFSLSKNQTSLTIKEFCSIGRKSVGEKWPNDVTHSTKKIKGIGERKPFFPSQQNFIIVNHFD